MAFDGHRKSHPEYNTPQAKAARAQLKADCKRDGARCARRGCRIDYDAPYWLHPWGKAGPKQINPVAFVAGHKRDHADGGPYVLENLQPECARCSAGSGAASGAKRRWQIIPKQRAARARQLPSYTDPRW